MRWVRAFGVVLAVAALGACGEEQVVARSDGGVEPDRTATNPDGSTTRPDGSSLPDGGFSADGGLACACERWETTKISVDDPRSGHISSYRFRDVEVAFDGTEHLAVLKATEDDSSIVLEVRDLSGSLQAGPVTLCTFPPEIWTQRLGPVLWNGEAFVAFWWEGDSEDRTLRAEAIRPDGTVAAGPATVASGSDYGAVLGGATLGGTTFLALRERRRDGTQAVAVLRLDRSLAAVGSPMELTDLAGSILDRLPMATLDDRVALLGFAPDTKSPRWALLDGDGNVTGPVDLSRMGADFIHAASNGQGRALVCYNREQRPLFCRFADLATGQPDGPEFVARDEDTGRSWRLQYAGCAYQLVVGWQPMSGPASSYRVLEVDEQGNVREKPFARYWAQPTQSLFAFRSETAGLVTALPAPRRSEDRPERLLITKAVCGRDEPWPSCEELDPILQDMACGGACDMSSSPFECAVAIASSGRGGPRDQFAHLCQESADRLACSRAIQGPQECNGPEGTGGWIMPPDCALPW